MQSTDMHVTRQLKYDESAYTAIQLRVGTY